MACQWMLCSSSLQVQSIIHHVCLNRGYEIRCTVPTLRPKDVLGGFLQGPPRHQERKRYVNVKKNLWAPKSTIHCWFVEACFSFLLGYFCWLLALAPSVGSFRWLRAPQTWRGALYQTRTPSNTRLVYLNLRDLR